jgi:NAD(P)H dehydrogenase (quinone)
VSASPPRIAVLAGRGKTGRAVGSALRARGADVVTVGRAEWPTLATILHGCAAVYVAAPNFHPDERALVAEVLDAASSAGVQRVVYHSVASPYLPAMPHHLAKAASEDVVRRSGLAWSVLQPCAYVQNLLPGLAADPAAVRVPYDVDLPHALVDLADVAECAATVLLGDGHLGATYELAGPLTSMREAAAAAASVLGRPVAAERLDPEAWERGAGAGLPAHERLGLRAMFDYYDAHGFLAAARVAGLLLGRPPHGVAEVVARELAQEGSPDTGQATVPLDA